MSTPSMQSTVFLEKQIFQTSDFMKRLHTVEGVNDEIKTLTYSVINKVPWSSHQLGDLIQSIESDKVIYRPNTEMDYLHKVYLQVTLPCIRVKDDAKGIIRICWAYNLFHRIIDKATLKFGTKEGPGFSGKWLDFQKECNMKPGIGHDANYNRSIGNMKFLQEWSTKLPSWAISCPQPFYYTESMSNSLPVFLCQNADSKVKHCYTFRRRVLDLLRMQMYVEDEERWVDLDDSTDKSNFLEGIDTGTCIPIPVMKGRYSKIDDDEKLWKQKECRMEVLATTIVEKNTLNPIESGKKDDIKLRTLTPVYGIFFNAEHEKSRKINNWGNYTTNPYQQSKGWDPIRKVVHKYNGNERIVQDPTSFANMEHWYHCPSSPRMAGFGMYSKGWNPFGRGPDAGLVYNQSLAGSFEFLLDANSPLDVSGNSQHIKDNVHLAYRKTVEELQNRKNRSKDRFYINLFAVTQYIITFQHGKPVKIDDGSVK